MKLLTKTIEKKLRANSGIKGDHWPVVKFFDPCGAATWLFTELGEDGDSLFGLCDLGAGFPEVGYASLAKLKSIKGALGIGIEREMNWTAKKSLSQYHEEALEKGRIVA